MNREERLLYMRNYRLLHRKEFNEREKLYRESHRELTRKRSRESMRRLRAENPMEQRIKKRNYYHSSDENRVKMFARIHAQKEIPITAPCAKCGSTENLERHHPDYSKILDVVILCRQCHTTEHWRMKGMKMELQS